jgi:multidrug efflux pump subunit AcrA (membrane-fusion protein)
VHDNQAAKKHEVLFRIDPARLEIALRGAQANVDSKLAAAQEAEIALDHVPSDVCLVTGRTATVVVLSPDQTQHLKRDSVSGRPARDAGDYSCRRGVRHGAIPS